MGFAIDPKVEKLSLNYMDNETSFEKFINYYENISKFCSEKVGYIPNYIQYKLAIELADIVEIEDIDDVLTNGLTSSDIYDYLNMYLIILMRAISKEMFSLTIILRISCYI